MSNTKARHQELAAAADRLLIDRRIDPADLARPFPLRTLAKALVAATGCHYDTAKKHIAAAGRRARGEASPSGWGGKRANAGRPPQEETHADT